MVVVFMNSLLLSRTARLCTEDIIAGALVKEKPLIFLEPRDSRIHNRIEVALFYAPHSGKSHILLRTALAMSKCPLYALRIAFLVGTLQASQAQTGPIQFCSTRLNFSDSGRMELVVTTMSSSGLPPQSDRVWLC